MSGGKVALIVLGIFFVAIFVAPALFASFGAWLFDHGPHGYDEGQKVVNRCGVAVQIDSNVDGSYPVAAADFEWTSSGEDTTVDARDDLVIRVLGGEWQPLVVGTQSPLVVDGAACPVAAADPDVVVVGTRAPLLAESEILSIEIEKSPEREEFAVDGEFTTIVARVSPEQAAEWRAEFAMAPSSAPDTPPIAGAEPGAEWLASGAFDSVVAEGDLGAEAYLDLESGTLVARIWEWDVGS